MRKKSVILMLLSLVAVFTMSGCVDLFAVPGVSVSPDGQTIYFLGAPGLTMEGDAEMAGDVSYLTALNVGAGTDEVVFGDADNFVSAFDVNPSNGDVVAVVTTAETSTAVMLYNPAAGMREVATLPLSIGTSLQVAPNGEWAALTALLLPEGTDLETLDETDSMEAIAALDSVAYLVNLNSGETVQISNGDESWANVVTWSPDSAYLAYNAWIDSNNDGVISSAGGLGSMMGMGSDQADLSQIFVYDAGSNTTTRVESTTSDYAPVFLSNNEVAYISLDVAMMMMGGPAIYVYDVAGSSTSQVHQAQNLILGMAVSPDGSRVAWTELGSESDEEDNTPSYLFVSDVDFSNPEQVADVSTGLGFVDVPVWMPDGSGVLVTSTNVFATLLGAFSDMGMMFGEMAEDMGEEVEEEAMPAQQIILVDVSNGSTKVLYEGSMLNSNYFASLLGMASDPAMQDMEMQEDF